MHHPAWVLAPLLLIVILVWSGVAKVGRGTTLQSIIRNLRLPTWLLPEPLARSIPWIEIALAVALLAPWLPLYAVAAAVTLGLMVTYWLLIARGLTITPRPSCGCFGDAGDHAISGRTLARNTLLVAAAGASLAVALSGRTPWSLLADFSTNDWLWLVLAALTSGVVVLILGRPRTTVTAAPAPAVAPPGSEPGRVPVDDPSDSADDDYLRSRIPTAVVVDAGAPVTLAELASARAQLLIFIDCYCHESQVLAQELPDWADRMPALGVRLVCSMPHDAAKPIGRVDNLLLDRAKLTWRALDLSHSPSAVLLGADGYLAGGPVSGLSDIQQFAADIESQLNGSDLPAPVAD